MNFFEQYLIKRGETNRDVKAMELLEEADKKIAELDKANVSLAEESHKLNERLDELFQLQIKNGEYIFLLEGRLKMFKPDDELLCLKK
jgi:ribonuclease HI